MSRIFWDAMLLIYLLEDNEIWSDRVTRLLQRSKERGDQLFTSYLALGEILAGATGEGKRAKEHVIQRTLELMGFTFIAFDGQAVGAFGQLRSKQKVKVADAVHLACAAGSHMDLFITGDRALVKLHVPGIKFIADLTTTLL